MTATLARISHWLDRVGCGLTERRLRQLAEEGWFPEAKRNVVEAVPTLLGLVKYYRELRSKQGSDIEAERLRKTTEEADKLALENEKTRGSLVEVEAVYKNGESVFVALRARILSSGLSDHEKDELLTDLMQLKVGDFSESVRAGKHQSALARDSKATAAA